MTTTIAHGAAPVPRVPLWRRPVVRLAGSVVFLGLLFTILPFNEIVGSLRAVPWSTWPIALAVYLTLHLIGVTKWRLLINTAGADLSFGQAARAYYMGLFGNTFLPSIVGGDVVRAGVALRAARSKSGLILGSLVDRIQDVIGLGAVAGIGALLSPRALDAQSRRVFITLGAFLAAGAVLAVLVLFLFPARHIPFRFRRKLVHVRRAMVATARRPSALLAALVLGMFLQSALVGLNWWLGRRIGIEVPIYVWLFVWPLSKVSGLLPVTQGGIGVREAAQAALFAPFGVSGARAVAAGLVFEVVIISGGLLGGAIAFLLGMRGAQRGVEARADALTVSRLP